MPDKSEFGQIHSDTTSDGNLGLRNQRWRKTRFPESRKEIKLS